MNQTEAFRDAIAAAGLTPPGEIFGDGKLYRFSSNGRPKDESGWYKFFDDERPAGAFGCWRTDISSTWRSEQPTKFTPAEREAFKQRMREAEAARAAELEAGHAYAASVAADLWSQALQGDDHPYLQRKGINGTGARIMGEVVLVPMRHGPGALVGLQRIFADGSKRFIKGTPLAGAYTVLGRPSKTEPVIICEGYATGVTLHLATNHCVVVAFNAGNLLAVAKKIRAAMPAAPIIMAADDDSWTDGNPGMTAAGEAAAAINASFAVPRWYGDRLEKHTDFNDLHQDEGLQAVTECIQSASAPPPGSDTRLVKPARDEASHEPKIAGSKAEASSSTSGNAVHQEPAPPVILPVAGSDVTREDVFIYSATPLKTAELFQAQLPDDGKVIFWRGEFYTWNGHRYVSREAVAINQMLYAFMASCLTQKKNTETGDLEVVAYSPKKSAVEDVVHALRAVCYIDLPEPPSWITDRPGDWPASEIVAFRNGFLHWPTRAMRPSDPRLFVISALDFDFDSAAPAPAAWLAFLQTIWPTDTESVEALAEMFGYMLTDDTSQQKAFMMIGPPRCGKGTILRVLENMCGPHNRVSPSLSSLGTQFGLQPLVGKRVAMISDARLSGKTDQQPIVENILRITGEDSLTIDRKFLGSWSGKLSTRFVLASNETPAFSDASGALPNRFMMFKFTQSFLGREDSGLTHKLLADLPGIILWALNGLDRLRARGYLIAPESGRELADEMREQSSPIATFVAEKCILAIGASIERGELFTAWKAWCTSQGMDHPGTIVGFGRRLSAAVAGIGRAQPREGGTRLNYYTGLRLARVFDDVDPL